MVSIPYITSDVYWQDGDGSAIRHTTVYYSGESRGN